MRNLDGLPMNGNLPGDCRQCDIDDRIEPGDADAEAEPREVTASIAMAEAMRVAIEAIFRR